MRNVRQAFFINNLEMRGKAHREACPAQTRLQNSGVTGP